MSLFCSCVLCLNPGNFSIIFLLVYQLVLLHGLIKINIRMRSIIIIINVMSFSSGKHIRCKPTSLCKPCKLQSRSPDQHPRGMWGLGNFIINHPLLDWLITLLQIPPSTPSAPPLGCWSGGSDWSLQGLHKEIGLHLIYFLSSIKYSNAYSKIYIYHYVDTKIDFILHHTSICI